MLNLHLDQIDAQDAAIARIDKEVDGNVEPFRVALEMLNGIPGVRSLSAEVIVAEIGFDMIRFETAGHADHHFVNAHRYNRKRKCTLIVGLSRLFNAGGFVRQSRCGPGIGFPDGSFTVPAILPDVSAARAARANAASATAPLVSLFLKTMTLLLLIGYTSPRGTRSTGGLVKYLCLWGNPAWLEPQAIAKKNEGC
jgi:hypothetical protein